MYRIGQIKSYIIIYSGITVCGSGVGTFLFAPLASYLLDTYSWKTSNLIFASFFLICILCGLVMKPLGNFSLIIIQSVSKKNYSCNFIKKIFDTFIVSLHICTYVQANMFSKKSGKNLPFFEGL